MKKISQWLIIFTVFACLTTLAFGQEQYGNIEGTIKDPQGAVVPNVSVTIINPSTGFKRTTTTNDGGFFRVLQLPPGTYTVTTAASGGFSGTKSENVSVTLGNTTPLEISVTIGSATNVVDVTAGDSQPIDPSGTKVQTNLSSRQIELLPKGTNFTSVLKAVPGTRQEANAGGFQVDGASGSENSFIIDGQEVNNFRTGAIRTNQTVPTQFVSEVSLKSSGFEAEFGGATGGVVNVVTKGGSNDWHGEFGSQFTSNKLEGANRPSLVRFTAGSGATFVQPTEYVTAPKNAGHSFLPTANLSGPIVKGKVWFFGSYTPQILDETRNVQYYTAGPSTTVGAATARSFRFAEEYHREQKFEYGFGRIDASPWSTLQLSGTYVWNPVVTQGAFPAGLVGNANGNIGPTLSFGGNLPTVTLPSGTFTGRTLTDKQGGRETANNVTGQAVWTPTNNLIVSGRYSRGFANEKGGNYFAVMNTQYLCAAGNPLIANSCVTNEADAVNGAVVRDVSIRTNYQADATYVVGNLGGRHEFKGGYGWLKLLNDVANGWASLGRVTLWYDGSTITDRGSTATPTPGAIGNGTLNRTGTFGVGANTSQSIFFQDKWQPTSRLTLNLGLRFEKEDLPSFNGLAPPINFGWGEKIVPRIGVAYDLFGDGKNKIFGSYSQFSDRVRFDLPRGSFGGDFFRVDFFEIFPNSGPFRTAFTLNSILGNFNDAPGGSCPKSGFIGSGLSRCQADFRIASNDPNASLEDGKVDPNLKPFRQAEITIGFQRQLTKEYRLSTRYVYKNVLSAVEDAGVRNAAGSEAYILGNPGEGLHLEQLKAFGYAKSIKPQRRFDAIEFVLEKQFSNHYHFNLNYTYSRLYGNYSGLASSDEAGRTSPGVNRFFDLPHIGFTALGEPDNGRLATDRPHVFNAFGAYIFDWKGSKSNETTLSFFTTFESGTPVTSTVNFYTTSVFLKRGDLGRTPFFTQTDLSFSHKYRFGSDNRFAIAFDFNMLNAFDQKIITGYFTNVSAVTITEASFGLPTATAATNAYTSGQLLTAINTFLEGSPTALNRRDARYKQPNAYQAPRGVRFGFRLLF